MEAYPSSVLLDVGANIGTYALVIEAMSRKVIAVQWMQTPILWQSQELE